MNIINCPKLFAIFLIIASILIASSQSTVSFNTKPTVRKIQLPNGDPFNVVDSDGWIIIQRRIDGSQDFGQNWQEYVDGFGDLHGEFFIGLEKLHLITSSQRYVLNISVEFESNTYEVQYDDFRVGNSESSYNLESVGQFKGYEEMDALEYNKGQPFSTKDRDYHDVVQEGHGGWWFAREFYNYSNLNAPFADHMHWNRYGVKSVIMKIRPYDDLNPKPHSQILTILYNYFFHL